MKSLVWLAERELNIVVIEREWRSERAYGVRRQEVSCMCAKHCRWNSGRWCRSLICDLCARVLGSTEIAAVALSKWIALSSIMGLLTVGKREICFAGSWNGIDRTQLGIHHNISEGAATPQIRVGVANRRNRADECEYCGWGLLKYLSMTKLYVQTKIYLLLVRFKLYYSEGNTIRVHKLFTT